MVVKQGHDFLCHDLTSVIKASVKSYLLKKKLSTQMFPCISYSDGLMR